MEKVDETKNTEPKTVQEDKPKLDTSHINKEYNTSTIISSTVLDKKKDRDIPITFGPINRNNYNQLKQLNNMTLPVRYLDGFYLRIVHNLRFGRFAYFNDIIVGSISWKYDDCEGVKSVYLMTISVLDEYRRYGIGSKLLKEVIRIHKNVKELACINLHVQISNKVALKFYERHNFESVKLLENYYTGVEVNPKDAYYLRYNLHEENKTNKDEITSTA
jgi:ribosomal protein S18 acetylase RimI-like enzyme